MNLLNNLLFNVAVLAQAAPGVYDGPVIDPDPALIELWQSDRYRSVDSTWTLSMLVPVVLGAVGYLLIQHGVVKSRASIAGGVVSLFIAVGVALGFTPGTFESCILMMFCALATGGARAVERVDRVGVS